MLANVLERLGHGLLLVGDDSKWSVCIFVYNLLTPVGHGNGAAGRIEVVAVDFIRWRYHGQKPQAVDVIAGDIVMFISFCQKIADGIIYVPSGHPVPYGFKPVAGTVIGILAGSWFPYTYQTVLTIKGIGFAVYVR